MYGTIFKLQVKPGHEQALLSLLKDQTPPDGGGGMVFDETRCGDI